MSYQKNDMSKKDENSSSTLMNNSFWIRQFMRPLKEVFLYGLYDALSFGEAFRVLYEDKSIRSFSLKCLVLNGFLFLGSMTIFIFFIAPLTRAITLSSINVNYGNNNNNTIINSTLNLTTSTTQNISNLADPENMATIFDYFFRMMYYVFWLYPIYALSFLLNTLWYQDIADLAYLRQVGKPKPTTVRVSQRIADEIYRIFLILVYLVEISLWLLIPYIGQFIAFLKICWLYGFYCFEYRWINQGWMLQKQLDYFEEHWAYFIGFGTPCTLVTFFVTTLVSNGLFALIFPLLIIMANRAKPIKSRELEPKRVRMFIFAELINGYVLRLFRPPKS